MAGLKLEYNPRESTDHSQEGDDPDQGAKEGLETTTIARVAIIDKPDGTRSDEIPVALDMRRAVDGPKS